MISQANITANTPVGTQVLRDGATFKVWAPRALRVYLNGSFDVGKSVYDKGDPAALLSKDASGYWTGFQSGATDGDKYRYWIVGPGSTGYKRDPYARELEPQSFPNSFAILRRPDSYSWHATDFQTPDFADMIVYQLHVGAFAIKTPGSPRTFSM